MIVNQYVIFVRLTKQFQWRYILDRLKEIIFRPAQGGLLASIYTPNTRGVCGWRESKDWKIEYTAQYLKDRFVLWTTTGS